MYPITDEVKSLLARNYRQIVSITGKNGTKTFELTESDIAQGGLSINRYCVSGSKIEIGSAVASELTLKLDNRDDRYADTHFEGVEVEVKIGIKKWDALSWEKAQLHWIPCGYFTVDETPRKLAYITLTALDRMVRFDKEVNADDLTFPTTIAGLLTACCNNCNVPLKTLPSTLTNANYTVQNFPESDDLTYRRIIQWIAEISGTCAYVDWEGKLCFGWYSENDFALTPSERYSSDMYEQDITITGVQISDDDDNVYLAGTDDYAFNIENNGLIQDSQNMIAAAIYKKVKDFTYRPYTCTCKPMPYVYPLDGVIYTDKNGVKHKSIVTSVTFKMNASTSLEGKGETNVKNGYATANPLTKGEAIVLKKLENRVNKKISNFEQASLDLNELMSSSLGLYRSTVTDSDGSVYYYYHNAATLADSTIIYTFKANGFAWTNKWDGDETAWQYGITKDGNAVLNILSVLKLTAEQIDATDLYVKAANIDGTLNASQINADDLQVKAANITGTLTAEQIEAKAITTEKLAVGAIGGFNITKSYIEHGGKTTYNDAKDGVFISPDGIGLGKGKFYVTSDGEMWAESAHIAGEIVATSGTIGTWSIGANDNYLHSTVGVYGKWKYSTTGTNLMIVTGWRFVALAAKGVMYIVKDGFDYDESNTLVENADVQAYSGSIIGGDTTL